MQRDSEDVASLHSYMRLLLSSFVSAIAPSYNQTPIVQIILIVCNCQCVCTVSIIKREEMHVLNVAKSGEIESDDILSASLIVKV